MSFLTIGLIFLIYPFIIYLCTKSANRLWKKALLAGVMMVPIGIYFIPYFRIQALHERMCAIDAGLRTLRPIEPSDSLRIFNRSADLRHAQSYSYYAPKLKYLELNPAQYWEAKQTSNKDARPAVAVYKFEPNEQFGTLMKTGRKDDRKFLAIRMPDEFVMPTVPYEYIERTEKIDHGVRSIKEMSRGGVVYLRYTRYRHAWSGVLYPDGTPVWQCPERFTGLLSEVFR